MMTTNRTRAAHTVAAALIVLAACGGQLDIGTGRDPLTGDACAPADCGSQTLKCASGTPTDVVCSHYQGGACAWSGKCPGDCNPAKCADYSVACADGTPTNLRCAPSPNAGHGSAPPDQCEILFDCTGDLADASAPDAPGADVAVGCTMASCANQYFACASGPASNLRCVPDPNAGHGSDPVGSCILVGDCPPENGNDASTD